VLKYVSRMLVSLGCGHVYQAASGDEAAVLWGLHRDEITLLVSDFVMPELTGDQLAVRFLSEKPDLRVLFISGNDPFSLDSEIPLHPGQNFLQKPFALSDLHRFVSRGELAAA
jgi:YesN/AraC family two-component response regulator